MDKRCSHPLLALILVSYFNSGVIAQSAFDWADSPYNWANSEYNPVNSPYALQNSPYALQNSPNSVNPANGVFNDEGDRIGYYVPNQQGSTNVFDVDGNRQLYVPETIPVSIEVGPFNPNQLSHSPNALNNSPYALENSPNNLNQNNGLFTPDGDRVGYVAPSSNGATKMFYIDGVGYAMPQSK
ncbi:hypothetical protein D521_1296 [beta proteobacterium CB]|nr:hypothetical protein D521_1296 [beta proteobacterium CB]